jgi:hypothetical protein
LGPGAQAPHLLARPPTFLSHSSQIPIIGSRSALAMGPGSQILWARSAPGFNDYVNGASKRSRTRFKFRIWSDFLTLRQNVEKFCNRNFKCHAKTVIVQLDMEKHQLRLRSPSAAVPGDLKQVFA